MKPIRRKVKPKYQFAKSILIFDTQDKVTLPRS